MTKEEIEKLRQSFYTNSPFDLCSPEDDKYRDAVDETLGEPNLCTICKGKGIEKHTKDFYTDCTHCRNTGIEPIKQG